MAERIKPFDPDWIERGTGEPVRHVDGYVECATSWDVMLRVHRDPQQTSHLMLLHVWDGVSMSRLAVSDGWMVPVGSYVQVNLTGNTVRRRGGIWADEVDEDTLFVNGKKRTLQP